MAAKTRFGLEGYGVRPVGSFGSKAPDSGSGPHPVGIITRFGMEGYGVRRASSFAGKTLDTSTPNTQSVWHLPGGFGRHSLNGKGYSQ